MQAPDMTWHCSGRGPPPPYKPKVNVTTIPKQKVKSASAPKKFEQNSPPPYKPRTISAAEIKRFKERGPPPPYKAPTLAQRPTAHKGKRFQPPFVGIPEHQVFVHVVPGKWGRRGGA